MPSNPNDRRGTGRGVAWRCGRFAAFFSEKLQHPGWARAVLAALLGGRGAVGEQPAAGLSPGCSSLAADGPARPRPGWWWDRQLQGRPVAARPSRQSCQLALCATHAALQHWLLLAGCMQVVVRVRPPLPRELRVTGLRPYQCTTHVDSARILTLSENLSALQQVRQLACSMITRRFAVMTRPVPPAASAECSQWRGPQPAVRDLQVQPPCGQLCRCQPPAHHAHSRPFP